MGRRGSHRTGAVRLMRRRKGYHFLSVRSAEGASHVRDPEAYEESRQRVLDKLREQAPPIPADRLMRRHEEPDGHPDVSAVFRGPCWYNMEAGWWCSRGSAHQGPCALRPRWWNIDGHWLMRHARVTNNKHSDLTS